MVKKAKQAFVDPTTVLDALSLFEWSITAQPNDHVKSVESSISFDPNHTIYDLSVKSRGFDEDELYAKDLLLRNNIRRGNSVLVRLSPAQGQPKINRVVMAKNVPISDIWFIRRGMHKFFDLYPEFTFQNNTKSLNSDGSFAGNFPIRYNSKDSHKEQLRKIIFYDVEQAIIREGASIDIYKSNKANGENAQVSYAAQINSWIIASKNVSFAARNEADLDLLGLERYTFAKLIGIQWFRYLSKLDPEAIEQLKHDLDGFTLVGEYVGNQDYQHLVKYNETTIMFFAYIDNNSPYSFVPPLRAFALFDKYHLNRVHVDYIGNFQTLDSLYSALGNLYNSVSSETIDDGGEGSVIYLVKNQTPDSSILHAAHYTFFGNQPNNFTEEELLSAIQSQTSLSASKLKTLEYRIYRKLREKLKAITSDKSSAIASKVYTRYTNEVQELVRDVVLPKPLEHYFKIAEVAFAFVEKQKLAGKKLKEGYIDFLDMIIERVDAGKNPVEIESELGERPNPLIVVIATPPFTLSPEDSQTIISELRPTATENYYNPKMLIKEGLKVCFTLDKASIGSPDPPKHTLFVYLGCTQAGYQKTADIIESYQGKKAKDMPGGMQGYVTGKYVDRRLEELKNRTLADIAYLEEKRPDQVIYAGEEDLQSVIPKIKERIAMLRGRTTNYEEEVKIPERAIEIDDNVKKIFVIVPMGIPAMGKSFMVKSFKAAIEKYGSTFGIISSDAIRAECMQEFMEKSGNFDKDNAFTKTLKPARAKFSRLLTKEMETKSQSHVIFLDKNHPPNSIPRTLNEIKKNSPKKTQVRVVALVPECREPFVINDARRDNTYTYELSLSFLTQCMLRIKNRIEHETLTGTLSHKIAVVMMMYNMYRNVHFDDYLDQGFHFIIKVPFTEEDNFEIDEAIRQSAIEALMNFKPEGMPNEHIIRELVNLIDQSTQRPPKINPMAKLEAEVSKIYRRGYLKIEENKEENKEDNKEPAKKIVEEEVKCEKSKPAGKNYKLPMYIGIDAEEWLKPLLVPIVTSFLRELSMAFPDPHINSDLQDIQSAILPGVDHRNFSEIWKFVDSLHVTTLFLGRNNKLTQSLEFTEFKENKQHEFVITHIVYVPQHIICGAADLFHPKIHIANKIPHTTLLTGKWAAKFSNEVLENIELQPGISHCQARINNTQVSVYSIALAPKLMVRGTTKNYY